MTKPYDVPDQPTPRDILYEEAYNPDRRFSHPKKERSVNASRLAILSGSLAAISALLCVWTADPRWFGTAMVLVMVSVITFAVGTFPRD